MENNNWEIVFAKYQKVTIFSSIWNNNQNNKYGE